MKKNIQLSALILGAFCFASTYSKNPDFYLSWKTMQQVYKSMIHGIEEENIFSEKKNLHPYWEKSQQEIKQLIMGPPNQKFLFHPTVHWAMVRLGKTAAQEYEACYLNYFLQDEVREKIKNFKDTDIGSLPREHSDFDCSTNTLGHLYYVCRIIEKSPVKEFKRIIEFGSGYGNLARIFKTLYPKSTIILIDLPELLALQYLFLTLNFPNEKIVTHNKSNMHFEEGCIHLVPTNFLSHIAIEESDVFVSNFALSETTKETQEIVIRKNFFNANFCYITGQLSGWGELRFVDHNVIQKSVKNTYAVTECNPFHLIITGMYSYEIFGSHW